MQEKWAKALLCISLKVHMSKQIVACDIDQGTLNEAYQPAVVCCGLRISPRRISCAVALEFLLPTFYFSNYVIKYLFDQLARLA